MKLPQQADPRVGNHTAAKGLASVADGNPVLNGQNSPQRVCFVLQVKPDRLEEYKQRHKTVWPEMLAALREAGWLNYSLFLREDGLLVGYFETEDLERARAEMGRRDVNSRWQREMAHLFVRTDGLLPDQTMEFLEEVFHL